MQRKWTALSRCAALVSAVLAGPVLAQTAIPGFELERLQPGASNNHSVALATGDVVAPGALRVSLIGHYEQDPLVFVRNGQRVGAVVGSRFTAHLGATYGVLDWLEVGLQLPIILGQGGDDLSALGIAPVAGAALGAPVLSAQGAFLREAAGNPLDLGVSLGLAVPLGNASGLTRDPGAGLAFFPRLGLGRSLAGLVRVGGEVGAVVREPVQLSRFTVALDGEVGSMLTAGANVVTLNEGLRGELTVRGFSPLTSTAAAAEVLAGVRYAFLDKTVETFLVGGPGIGRMPGAPLFRILGGVAWTPLSAPRCVEGQPYATAECPALDKDGDGVRNSLDTCPEVAGLAKLDGCPDKDDDGDGISNLNDACPAQKGEAKRGGCPAKDSDGDGVPDEEDACPKQAGVKGAKGCADVDSDGDGVVDALDKCPGEKAQGGADGCLSAEQKEAQAKAEAEQAAAKAAEEKAQAEKLAAEQAAAEAAEKGKKPAEVKVEKTGRISLSEKVRFELNKADIKSESFTLLDQVAKTLTEHPELKKVLIEGHTDNSGPAEFNTKLSQQRADAVRQYLIKKGIAAGRLESKGFGPSQPIAPNDTQAGREQNRRTEFHSVE